MKPHEYITLTNGDIFSRACFAEIQERIDAAKELLSDDCPEPLNTKYAAWWREMRSKSGHKVTDELTVQRVKVYRDLAFDIRDNGYYEDAWKDDPREEVTQENGFGPITVVIGPLGEIHFRDGNHRACVLIALGLPVNAWVYKRHRNWFPIVEQTDSLYQPHTHPDFAGLRVLRKDVERYGVIADNVKRANINGVIELGCCSGVGCTVMADRGLNVIGIESHEIRAEHCKAYEKHYPNLKIVKGSASGYNQCTNQSAIVGLSVWHHISRDLETMERTIRETIVSPLQFVELPPPHVHRWKKELLEVVGITPDKASEYLIGKMMEMGKYNNKELVYVDKSYEGRQTWMLSRQSKK